MQALPVKAEQGIAEIVRVQCASLSALNFGTGNTVTAQAAIAKLLLDTTGYFGVSWSKNQVTECASMWFSEYYWMSMAEIKLFLARLKTGEYTKDDYRHLSPFQFMGWLKDYTDEILIERVKYVDEREAAERHEKEVARMSSPDMMAFDAVKALEACGFKMSSDGKMQTESEKEEIYRQEKIKQRQRDVLRNQQNEQP